MRVVQNEQMSIGEIDIARISFDDKSRDDIPKILKSLQFVYTHVALRTAIFELLQSQLAPKVSKTVGRPGMTLWSILVCGVIRLDLDCDYDRLHELVNQHNTLREMLGHGALSDARYHVQTLKDNVSLLTPELLDQINLFVVNAGHGLVKKRTPKPCVGAATPLCLKPMCTTPPTSTCCGMRHVRCLMRTAQNKKRSKARSPGQVRKNEALTIQAHQDDLDVAQGYLDRGGQTLALIERRGLSGALDLVRKVEIEGFMAHAVRQIEQTRRRVILGEVIPHSEKVFSLFEPHTEWISKGKAGVPVELGVKVCILQDQHQFILHHQVMQNQTDDQVTLAMVSQARQRLPRLNACSFDKGVHSPASQTALRERNRCWAGPDSGNQG